MRLTCPNCGAQYEVPDSVIPFEGRDVQCSNCGNTWFQSHPENEAGAAESVEPPVPPSEPEPAQPDQAPRGIDPAVSDILREEAQRETQIREEEAQSNLESQPDLGLDEAGDETERRARQASERMARIKGETPAPVTNDADGTRRGLLPDIEEINSSLRSGEKQEKQHAVPADPAEVRPKPKKRGFTRGLALALLVAVILGFIYKLSPEIAQTVPQADPMLSAYVALVDQARLWLDTEVGPLVKPYLGQQP